jgi:predicted nuclease of predicted toxin-antitoxin system
MPWKAVYLPTKIESAEFLRKNKRRARFLVDESLGGEVAKLLRRAGWKAVFVGEVGLLGHPDEDILAYSYREDRILLTHDDDFLDDRRFPPHRNPGVVVLPGAEGQERALLRALGGMLSIIGEFRDIYRGSKISISAEGIWTQRNLNRRGAAEKKVYKFPKHGAPLVWEGDGCPA